MSGKPSGFPSPAALVTATVRGLALLALAMQLALWLPAHWHRTDRFSDIPVYYSAARAATHHVSPYTPWTGFGPDLRPTRFFYPPPFAALLAPLGQLSYIGFMRLWYCLLSAAFWVYAALLARLATGKSRFFDALIAGLALQLWPGANIAMTYGNAEPLLWALLALGVVALGSGRDDSPPTSSWASWPLVLAVFIKVHPLWALLASLWRGGRRAALGAGLAGALLIGLGWAVCGLGSYFSWWHAAAPVAAQGSLASDNVSIGFAGLRLALRLGWWHYGGGPLASGPRLYLALAALAGPALAFAATRRRSARLQVSCVAVAAAFCAPLCWTMYLPIALLPLAVWWGEAFSAPPDRGEARLPSVRSPVIPPQRNL